MATSAININGTTWTAITAAGESGSCWLNNVSDKPVFVDHSKVALGADCDFIKSRRVYFADDNGAHLSITADDTGDVWYAKCPVPSDTSVLVVDVK